MFGGLKKRLKSAINKFVKKEEDPAAKYLPEEKEEPKPEPEKGKKVEGETAGVSSVEYVDVPRTEKLEAEESEEFKKVSKEVDKIHEKELEIEKRLGLEPGKPLEKIQSREERLKEKMDSEVEKLDKAEEGKNLQEQIGTEVEKLDKVEERKVEKTVESELEKELENIKEPTEVEKEEIKKDLSLVERGAELDRRIEEIAKPDIPKVHHAEPPKMEPALEREPKTEAKPAPKEKKKLGFLQRIFKKVEEKKLDESEVENFLKELNQALLENDVAFEVAEKICADVKKVLVGQSVKRGKVNDAVIAALKTAMLDVMKQDKLDIGQLIEKKWSETNEPFVIVFCGFNGTGKTTTIAKLAYMLKEYKPVLAAGDTFRAASIEQLEEHGRRLDVKVIKHNYGSDSAAVIFDAIKHAESVQSKVVLADTAGRSHSNVNLMDELRKIMRVNKPDIKILVLDSITGNDIYDQSQLFNEAVGIDGIILTKADVYEKGGAALSASFTVKRPILFIGVGQEYEDLKDFVPEEIVNNLLG